MLWLDLDGFTVEGGLPQVNVGDDVEHIGRVDNLVGRTSCPVGAALERTVVALLVASW